jgi:signal peptidase II
LTQSDSTQDSPRPRHAGFPSLRDHLLFWPVAAGVLALDLWTKKAVFDWLSSKEFPVYQVIPNFLNLVLAENPGAAFSIAPGKRAFLISVAAVAAIVIVAIFLSGRAHGKLMKLSLALFVGGILGNLHDRLFNNGLVRDFIDAYYRDWHWPAFNVADSALCIAVALILLSNFLTHPGSNPNPKP